MFFTIIEKEEIMAKKLIASNQITELLTSKK